MSRYYSDVVQEMDIASLFGQFIIHFGWLNLDREQYVSIGQSFVRFSTADAIFYGKYITNENDFAIYANLEETEATKTQMLFLDETKSTDKPIKTKRRKKNVISNNDVSGTGTTD